MVGVLIVVMTLGVIHVNMIFSIIQVWVPYVVVTLLIIDVVDLFQGFGIFVLVVVAVAVVVEFNCVFPEVTDVVPTVVAAVLVLFLLQGQVLPVPVVIAVDPPLVDPLLLTVCVMVVVKVKYS